MATTGNHITRTSFSGSWATNGTEYRWSPGSWWGYIYICAASFVMVASTDYHWLQSGRLTHVSVDCYNRATGAWQNVGPAQEIKGNGTTQYTFFHNRDAEGNKTGFNYRDNAVSRVNHLFRVNICIGYNNTRWRINVYAGGVGLMNDSEYASYARGRLVKGIGRTGSNVHVNANYAQNDAAALSTFNPDNMRGTVVYAANDHSLMPNWA